MVTVINILLALLSLIATLSAFGGRTWIEAPDQPLKKRITKRGYISLFCLFSVFTIGTFKEIYTNNLLTKKDDKIESLRSDLAKIDSRVINSEDILKVISDRTRFQVQTRMAQSVVLDGIWNAPSYVYPGSFVEFFTTTPNANQHLQLKYGSNASGYTTVDIHLNGSPHGSPYAVPIIGHSGQPLTFSLLGRWGGKVFVYSTPVIRSSELSWAQDAIPNATH